MKTSVNTQQDIRDVIFAPITNKLFTADITVERDGILSGVVRLKAALLELGVTVDYLAEEGTAVTAGRVVATITGFPKQIALAEEFAIGLLAKSSGIATAANRAVVLAGDNMRVVSGAWKKVSPELKGMVREAIAAGGAISRIADQPFLYLDKNFIRMLGGIEATLAAVQDMPDKLKVIQLKGDFYDITQEAVIAVENGANILMIDTGNLEDVVRVNRVLIERNWRSQVKLAFAKGINLEAIPGLTNQGIDVLDIGASIIDAPLLDMKLDVRYGG